MVATFRIVLKQEEGFDVHDTREFELPLDSKFAIGRASKNQAKGYLQPGKNNVFIDSPVVSREHAVFTANTSTGAPHVFVTDTKSMHGTYVNGTPLVPHTPKQLFNGDKLQFGVNVNRNESYFMAYKYTFKADLSDTEPFSRGFTVPEADSEEELDFTPSRRGSQLYPLILDDSDAEMEPEVEENVELAEHSDDNLDVTVAQLDEEDIVDVIDLAEDDDAADSVADGMSSDVESDEASTGDAFEYDLDSPLIQEAPNVEEFEVDVEVEVEVPATQDESTLLHHGQPPLTRSMPIDLSEPEQMPADPVLADLGPAIASFSHSPQTADLWLASGATSPEDTPAPPLPPRPSQKRQRIWVEETQEGQTSHGEAAVASPDTLEEVALFHCDLSTAEAEPIPTAPPAADRMQTPPHAEPAEAPSTPALRESDYAVTEVADVQPPTPTSINSRKRSADNAFEEETEELITNRIEQTEVAGMVHAQAAPNVEAQEDIVIPTVEEATIRSQRPIAQPKGIFRRALNAAKVVVPATALGAVFTVTALTTLPESFFTVA